MSKHLVGVLVLAVGLLPRLAAGQAPGESLPGRLPADATILYGELDVGGLLAQGQEYLAFGAPEAGGRVAFQLEELYRALRQLAAAYEFEPTLLDVIPEVKLHFVLMAMEEPKVTVHTYRAPKWDEKTWEPIPGEFDEHTYEETQNYVFSLVVETPDQECAANFLEEFKALLDRQAERHPDEAGFERKDFEVERGELVGDPDETATVGRLDEYVIVSNGVPRELWGALMAEQREPVSATALYRRLRAEEHEPQGMLVVNIEALVRRAEEGLKRRLEEAEQEAAERAGEQEAEERFRMDWELEAARAAYKTFTTANSLLSLDRWKQGGASTYLSASDERVVSGFKGAFVHAQDISPILEELLSGSGTYTLPPTGELDAVCAMGRVDLRKIYDEVARILGETGPEGAAAFTMAMMQMKMMVGADLGEILGLLDSDVYFFVDMVEREIEVPNYEFDRDAEEPTITMEKRMMVQAHLPRDGRVLRGRGRRAGRQVPRRPHLFCPRHRRALLHLRQLGRRHRPDPPHEVWPGRGGHGAGGDRGEALRCELPRRNARGRPGEIPGADSQAAGGG